MSIPAELLFILDDAPLPAPHRALGAGSVAPGLVAVGPPPTLARLEQAYAQATFPCYGARELPLWWCPDPRMVLDVQALRVTRSLRQRLRATRVMQSGEYPPASGWAISASRCFDAVMAACASTPRRGQKGDSGVWILPELRRSYGQWHRLGRAHSVEVWCDGVLAGGLYGVNLGAVFFGESMFSWRSDASKIALAALVAWCQRIGIPMIDCQMHSAHLESLGARQVPLDTLLRALPPAAVCEHPDHPAHVWRPDAVWPADLLDGLAHPATPLT
ncbi:leucyl/phenylalanyl-tRNA--protein transferase [Amphibiibacter pelophylacis]|uniref:Leucyl/phenylalanyl-tRNA--protein transferase n=1 Tax=Amphibiibacter pelophylacis TaxID=1799477 RepID=A0ACC6P374_9BURK